VGRPGPPPLSILNVPPSAVAPSNQPTDQLLIKQIFPPCDARHILTEFPAITMRPVSRPAGTMLAP
jgi:hypothetical protein